MFKYYIKLFLPNFIINSINKLFNREIKIIGHYKNWKEAVNNSLGYDNKKIFNKSKESFLKIINGHAKYERDSVLFYSEKINYSLINILIFIQRKKNICLNVLDFGGSFGSTYFQNISILQDEKKFNWLVVEQKSIVDYAKNFKLNKNLQFFLSNKDCLKKFKIDVVLFSGVLQYLQNPFFYINFLFRKKIDYFMILRTPFHDLSDSIRVQIIPKHIYEASYPIRIFNEHLFIKNFKNNNYYLIKSDFKNELIHNVLHKNFIFKYNI
jgi:putative methyltransferase (TIGR04325 family)